ncbi:hypothetical protein CRI70_31075 [Streptomyces sp. Ru87]|nr:hypothetical protein CRI70_31075 [Streptomyces sp. Ru87]
MIGGQGGMTELVRFELAGDRGVVVETGEPADGLTPVRRGADGVVDSATHFTERLATVRDAVGEALTQLRDRLGPDDITVSFGVKFTAEAGAVIARTAVEGNLAVEMTWHRSPGAPPAAADAAAPPGASASPGTPAAPAAPRA